jgi:hypothetical protein
MKKTHYDAKSDLKPAQGSVQRTSTFTTMTKPDILPFLSDPAKNTLNEIIDDLTFLTGRAPLDPFDLFEVFIHFWIHETNKNQRMDIARKLHAARRFAYRRGKEHEEAKEQELEDIADRLLAALGVPKDLLN